SMAAASRGTDVGGALARTTEVLGDGIRGITGNIRETREQVASVEGMIDETGSSLDGISRNVAVLNEQIESQVSAVTQAGASIEEMVSSLRSMADLTASEALKSSS
ncbi:MAG: hypothetical protein ACOC05_04280, partial [Oceanicaulis sp.]